MRASRRIAPHYRPLARDQPGISPVEPAIAFVLRHPAATSAIVGPRTMEHLESQLTAADVTLSDEVLDRVDELVAAADVTLCDEVLDRVDEIVPPGLTLNPAGNGWVSPLLEAAARRR